MKQTKYINGQMTSITNLIAEITTMTQQDCDEAAYNQKRVALNQLLIETLAGCEISDNKKGETTVKFNKTLPDMMTTAKIAAIIDTFVGEVENPYLLKISGADPESMEIPVTVPGGVTEIEKPTNKALKGAILEGIDAWYRKPLDGKDCYMISAIGDAARKDANLKKALIISGVILVVAAGTAGYYFYTKNKKEEVVEAQPVDDAEDVPVVEIDEDMPDDEVCTDSDVDDVNVEDAE